MAPQSEIERLQEAWRALAGEDRAVGWRTIPIHVEGPCRILAGRLFPDNAEALVIGLPSVTLPTEQHLPQGRGFTVTRPQGSLPGGPYTWMALARQPVGNRDFFTMMASDVVGLLVNAPATSPEGLLGLFLSRVRAWQEFMGRDHPGVLSADAETGLYGELVVLRAFLEVGLPAPEAVHAWQGPLHSLHDFVFGSGAVEVKATVALTGFPARVSSLEQLDPSLTQPLFLAGVRLAVGTSGMTLPDLVDLVRRRLAEDLITANLFASRLLHAGYLEAMAEHYTRRFATIGMRVLAVSPSFPGLARYRVHVAIRQATYELDLDLLNAPVVTLEQACTHLKGGSLGIA